MNPEREREREREREEKRKGTVRKQIAAFLPCNLPSGCYHPYNIVEGLIVLAGVVQSVGLENG
jgi:hypothetical protein